MAPRTGSTSTPPTTSGSGSFKVGANTSRWTLRDLDGKVLREYLNQAGTWSVQKDYVYRGSQLLAAWTPSGVNQLHLDHLGTVRAVTNPSGSRTAFHVYYPFGEEATSPTQDSERMKFTGHERDLGNPSSAADDLDYMHARFYNPQLGRFLSVDPSKQSWRPAVPQSWNRYAYALSSPTKYIDPNGQLPVSFQLIDMFSRAVQNVAEFFGGVGQGTLDNTNLSPVAGAAPSGSSASASGRALANFVANNPVVVEASLNVDTGAGPSAVLGLSAVNGNDFYAFLGVGRSMSVSPVSGTITIGTVAGYEGRGSYSGLFTSATAGAPVGVSFSANPLSTNSPGMIGITFSSDVGVFSQSQTYYISLDRFKELQTNGGGYVLIQGELVRVYAPK
jgi:RHS repeat-associated protein